MNVKIQGLLVVLGATLVGVAGGVVVERTRDATPTPRWTNQQGPPWERFGRGGQRGSFPRGFEDLQLTQEQRHHIDSIFQAWQPRTEAVLTEFLPRMHALRDSVRIEVDAVLTPEQREKLQEIMPPAREGRNPFRGRRGGDRPGGLDPDSSRDLR